MNTTVNHDANEMGNGLPLHLVCVHREINRQHGNSNGNTVCFEIKIALKSEGELRNREIKSGV